MTFPQKQKSPVLSGGAFGPKTLNIVIKHELVGVRTQANGIHFLRPLVVDPFLDQVLGEDPALQQVLVVVFQGFQCLRQGGGNALDLLEFASFQLVKVHVMRLARIDLVLDPIQARHQHCGEGQVGVAGRVWRAELDALGLRALGVERDTAAGRAVSLAVHQVHRSLKAGGQTLVAVHRGGDDRAKRRRVLQQTTDVIEGIL